MVCGERGVATGLAARLAAPDNRQEIVNVTTLLLPMVECFVLVTPPRLENVTLGLVSDVPET